MTVEESLAWSREVARSRARNFYYAFRLLDRSRRDALCAVYAFMRQCDDLSDEPGATAAGLQRWREDLGLALEGRAPDHPLWPGFLDTVRRYAIPRQYFEEMIDGVGSDLSRREFATFAELYKYCYQVASVAGLSLTRIFGCDSREGLELAEKCGVAFQITNILRDVGEDHAHGRVYLPREDRERFGVGEIAMTAEFRRLMAFEAARARGYYEESRPLIGMVDPGCRASLWALIEIYSRLLGRIEASGFDVLDRRIRLPAMEKSWIGARAVWSKWSSG